MSTWFFPEILDADAQQEAVRHSELALPANGMPDLSRAQDSGQIAAFLRRQYPEAPPEFIATQREHYWRLGHELLLEDYIILRTAGGHYIVGEITGSYRREPRAQGMAHIWPVTWLADIAAAELSKLAPYSAVTRLTEITDSELLAPLQKHIPALRNRSAAFFKWLGMVILVAELVYFWPRGS